MRPRLSALGLASRGFASRGFASRGLAFLGSVLIALAAACAIAPAARAQSTASNIPATWSTDPDCGAQALRVTFGGSALAIERNGRLIYRGPARLAISDDEIAVRLGTEPVRADSERNTIRFNRAGDALRLVSATVPGAGAQFARVPPLYACRPPGVEAAGPLMLPASATLPAPAP